MSRLVAAVGVCVLFVISVPGQASASGGPSLAGAYLPVGLNVGFALHEEADAGLVLGGEASLAVLQEDGNLSWFGVYGDAVYDFGADALRVSAGPEVGYFFFGLDGGLVLQNKDDETNLGVTVRGTLSMAFGHLYLRGGVLFGDEDNVFGEGGILLKFPFPLG